MNGSTCCGCGCMSAALSFKGEGYELQRGMVYIGHGKFICATCTQTAVAGFAKETAKHFVAKSKPPEGFL
jgi:hypothetical protein